jgi:hypothetical protein
VRDFFFNFELAPRQNASKLKYKSLPSGFCQENNQEYTTKIP